MLYYAAIFFVVALVAAVLGFGGIAAGAAEIAKILFYVFLALTAISLVASLFRNFLLAERIMRSYNCTPMASPKLPPTYYHPMWLVVELAKLLLKLN
ncbi:DUF1328 domain-containing protein [bacterium]|nr:DUF1328 domain-containing protein [bacterium]